MTKSQILLAVATFGFLCLNVVEHDAIGALLWSLLLCNDFHDYVTSRAEVG